MTNVVLIIWDAARADHTFILDYPRNTTPFLKSLASESFVFPHAVAQGFWSLPSIASIFTGKYVSKHKMTMQTADESRTCPMHKHSGMLPENLKKLGYSTWAFIDDDWLNERTGFTRGFDFYRNYPPPNGRGRAIDVINDIKKDFRPEKPFFLFVNLLDTHDPYIVPKDFQIWAEARNIHLDVNTYFTKGIQWGETEWRQIRDRYDEALRWLDYVTGELWKWMNSQGYLDDAIFIVLGDHGEYLGEHGLFHHTCAFYDEILRVMLVIWTSERRHQIVDEQFELRKLYHLISLANIPIAPPHTGIYAVAECPEPRNIMAIWRKAKAGYDNPHLFSAKTCVRTKEWKFIMNSQVEDEFYDLVNDPKETKNLYINDNTREIRGALDFLRRSGLL